MTQNQLQSKITKYKNTFYKELEQKRMYLNGLTDLALAESIQKSGMVLLNKKFIKSTHFLNNFWYNMMQKDSNGKTVQLSKSLSWSVKRRILGNASISTFDQIFSVTQQICDKLRAQGIKGAAQMTIYDVSLYAGFKMNIVPEKVYVHQGVCQGAYDLGLTKFKTKEVILEMNDVLTKQPLLASLHEAYHIENFLCLLKRM